MLSDFAIVLIASIGFLAFALLLVALERRDQERRANEAKNEANKQQQSGLTNGKKYPSDEEHRAAEQRNWYRQNFLTGIAVCLSLFAVVAGIAAWQESRRQAEAAQGQLDVARDEQRAWIDPAVSMSSLETGVDYRKFGSPEIVRASVDIKMTNVGKSTAINVWPFVNIIPVLPWDPLPYLKDVCQNAKRAYYQTIARNPFVARVIFPNRADSVPYLTRGETMTAEAIRGAQKQERERRDHPPVTYNEDILSFATFSVIGCVSYQLGNDTKVRQTGIIANCGPTGNGVPIPVDIRIKKIFGPGDLVCVTPYHQHDASFAAFAD